jgi:hypothetical protein
MRRGRFRLVEDDSGDRVGYWFRCMTTPTAGYEMFVEASDLAALAALIAWARAREARKQPRSARRRK